MRDLIFTPIGNALDGLFEEAFRELESDFFGISKASCNCGKLRTNVIDNEDNYVIQAEVPGLADDQVDVSYEDNVLTITANWGEKKEGEGFKEVRTGKYSKSFSVGGVDVAAIDAKMANGILTLTVPKAENTKARKIEINKS